MAEVGNANDIEAFHNNIEEWTSRNYLPNGFGVNWLGNIVQGAGLGRFIAPNCPEYLKLRCRGELIDIYDIEDRGDASKSFSISTSTAWCEMPRMFVRIVEEFGYDIKIAYQAEECGNEIYIIYDPDNLGCYDDASLYLEFFISDDEEEVLEKYPVLKELSVCDTYWNSGAFLDFINKYGFTSVDNFNDFFNENLDDNDFVVAHKFDYVNEIYA